ncbi:MAG: hypothetical protein WCG25_07410 [bacterium]
MNINHFLLVAGGLAIILFIAIFFILRSKSKKSLASGTHLDNFLAKLYTKFCACKSKYLPQNLGPQMTNEQIASDIAEEISQDLSLQLQISLSNMTEFSKTRNKTFGNDVDANHFIDKMIPNLSMLYFKYNNTDKAISRDDCEKFLLKVVKLKAMEVLISY